MKYDLNYEKNPNQKEIYINRQVDSNTPQTLRYLQYNWMQSV